MQGRMSLYADGGTLGPGNPSPFGGTWAWCLVDEQDVPVQSQAGLVLPATNGKYRDPAVVRGIDLSIYIDTVSDDVVTNNQSEFYAILHGLEAMGARWSGQVCSDSQVTLGRFFDRWKLTNIPSEWAKRMGNVLRRTGQLTPVLHQGHPTKADLVSGLGKKRNLPVSKWNVWCDEECGRVRAEYERAKGT